MMDGIIWFYLILGILAVLAVIYSKTKKLYNVMYGLSAVTQVITVAYVLSKFNFGKNGILLVLIAAAFVMMAEGYLMTQRKKG